MLKQPITFTDFNNVERTEEIYFNLTEAELVDWSADSEEGIQKDMQDAILAKDMRKLLDFIKTLINKSYGERDKDGIHFHKSPELSKRFENSAMYSPLLLALFADEGATVTNFINGLMPADLVKRAMEQGNIPNPGEVAAINAQYAPSARDIATAAREQAAAPQYNEAPVIGRPDLQAPITPTVPEAAPDSPPIQVGTTNPVDESPKPFRVKETPMDEDIAEERRQQQAQADQDAADFAEFKRRREAGEL